MIPIGTPAPQWQDLKSEAVALRLVPVVDGGIWGVEEGADPDGAYEEDGGIVGIDDTTTTGLKVAQTPSGVVGIY